MGRVTSTDGTGIAFDRLGEGPAVIVVSGANCDRATKRGLAEHLARQFTVLNYDRRGRGDSGDTAPYAVQREVEDLQALVAEAGGPVSVYGHSSGAALAVHAAAQGVPIARLVLHEPPYTPEPEERRRASERYARELTALLAQDRGGDAVALFMAYSGTPPELIGRWRQEPWWAGLEALAPTLAYDSAVMGDASRGGTIPADDLRRVTPPTLVLTGGASPAWMNQVGDQVAKTLSSGQHVVLADQHHVVPPEVLAPVLMRFFAGEQVAS